MQTFTDPVYTRNVWIVSPTYMLVFRILDDAGLHHKLRAVPEDEEGIDIEYLGRELKKSERKARTEGNNHSVSAVICLRHVQLSISKEPITSNMNAFVNLSLLGNLLLAQLFQNSFCFVNP